MSESSGFQKYIISWLFQVLVCIFVFVVAFVITLIISEVLTHTHSQVQLSIFYSHSDTPFMHGQPWKLCTELSERRSSPIYFWLMIIVRQGGRSCAKSRRAFVEKFGLGQIFQALTYPILSQIVLFLGKKCTITWYIYCISWIIMNYICKFAITCKITNLSRTHENFVIIFAFTERLPTFATLL